MNDEQLEQRIDELEKLRRKNRFYSVWSIMEADLATKHGFKEQTLIYNQNAGKPVTVTIDGDRWMDLWKAADTCIRKSGDKHHVFIEEFQRSGGKLFLITGS